MKPKILFILLVVALSTGCKKLINEPDHSILSTDAVFGTTRDVDNLLYGAYGALANGNTLAGNWRIFPELLADHTVVNVNDNNPDDPFQMVYDRVMAQAQYPENWRLGYTAIQNANTVIYAIENNRVTKEMDPEFTDPVRDRFKGEAYFIRAMAYFDLVRLYGHQYGFNSTTANSGVILRTSPSINITGKDDVIGQGRATVEEVYQLIISDLKKAEDLLPPVAVPRRGRATSYAASAILARVYFQKNDYPNTLIEINKVLGITPGSIDFPYVLVRVPATGVINAAQAAANVIAPFKNTSTSALQISENIFDLVSVTGFAVNANIGRKYIRTTAIQPFLGISNTFFTDAAFVATDARKLTGMITTVTTKNYTKKYDQALMNIPVIRSAELVLDRAEINAELAATFPNGSQPHLDALADLNLIRDRAIPAYVFLTPTTLTSVNVLAEVRRERIRELAFEGDRLHNLRRMHANVGPGARIGEAALPWNSNRLLFKIPDAEISTSTNIVQNPD